MLPKKDILNLSISLPLVRRASRAKGSHPVEAVRSPALKIRRHDNAIPVHSQGRREDGSGRPPEQGAYGEDGAVHGGDHESRRAARNGWAPPQLEGGARPALSRKADRNRRALRGSKGGYRQLRADSGEVQGRGDRKGRG